MNLTNAQRSALLKKLPKKAHYWKECLKAFWKRKFTPAYKEWEGYASESPWHGYRTEDIRRGLDYRAIQYFNPFTPDRPSGPSVNNSISRH